MLQCSLEAGEAKASLASAFLRKTLHLAMLLGIMIAFYAIINPS